MRAAPLPESRPCYIICVAYTDGRKLEPIELEDISDNLQHRDRFVWVALRDPSPRSWPR